MLLSVLPKKIIRKLNISEYLTYKHTKIGVSTASSSAIGSMYTRGAQLARPWSYSCEHFTLTRPWS